MREYAYKCGFEGKIFVYQLQTCKTKPFKNLPQFAFTSCTTTDIPIQFFSKNFGTKTFHTYGFQNGKGYTSTLKDINFDLTEKYLEDEDKALLTRYRKWWSKNHKNSIPTNDIGVSGKCGGKKVTKH